MVIKIIIKYLMKFQIHAHSKKMKDVGFCLKSCWFLVFILFGSKNELNLPCGKCF